jgi:hypothetical protein
VRHSLEDFIYKSLNYLWIVKKFRIQELSSFDYHSLLFSHHLTPSLSWTNINRNLTNELIFLLYMYKESILKSSKFFFRIYVKSSCGYYGYDNWNRKKITINIYMYMQLPTWISVGSYYKLGSVSQQNCICSLNIRVLLNIRKFIVVV